MKIVIASGKGGTGKSTVSANLAYSISRQEDVVLVDCDVEEPNLHLFFPGSYTKTDVTVYVPRFDENACNHCGMCGDFCRYGAITVLKDKVLFFEDLCHSCGGCRIICPNDAVSEVLRAVGEIRRAFLAPAGAREQLVAGKVLKRAAPAMRVGQVITDLGRPNAPDRNSHAKSP